MDNVSVKRIDHLGIVAGVIEDLGIVNQLDKLLPSGGRISTGKAIAGMIVNGLGFTDRPLSLTPEFFSEVAMTRLFGHGVQAENFNRHRLGRALDLIHNYGVSRVFSEVASSVALREGISTATTVIDTTTFSVTGQKYDDSDENCVALTHGYSKDHRPDLKQVVNELVVSIDGGFPLIMANHDGNASDSKIFKERCLNLRDQLAKSGGTLIGDAKLYSEDNALHLSHFKYVTRIPETIKKAKDLIVQAIADSTWQATESGYFFRSFSLTHYDMNQTWVVYYGDEGLGRSQKTINAQVDREREQIEKDLYHLHAKEFGCRQDALDVVKRLSKKWLYHQIEVCTISEIKQFAGRGRPGKDQKPDALLYRVEVQFKAVELLRENAILRKACFIIGTNDTSKLPEDLLREYKSQSNVERGFRFLKDPYFFTSSFFLKKPARIEALICVMSLALLVYSVAQRRLRQALAQENETIIDPIYGPTSRPTLRRVMQMFFGINEVSALVGGVATTIVTGVNTLRERIVRMISRNAAAIYSLNLQTG